MPDMGGMQLFDWIRRCQPASSAAFVLVTGGLLTPALQSIIESSHIGVLAKPFGAAALDTLLDEMLGSLKA